MGSSLFRLTTNCQLNASALYADTDFRFYARLYVC